MFESILLRKQLKGSNPIDIGFLVESLLFYQQVHVVGNVNMLKQLISVCSPTILTELLQLGTLKITFEMTQMGMYSPNKKHKEDAYLPMAIAAHEHQLDKLIPNLIYNVTHHRKRSRLIADQLIPHIDVARHENAVLHDTNEDLKDVNYLTDALPLLIEYYAPDYAVPDDLMVTTVQRGDCFRVDTNIDFSAVERHLIDKNLSQLNIITLLLDLLDLRDSLRLSATIQSELATGELFSQILQSRISRVIDKCTNRSSDEIRLFQQFIFEDSRSISEVINAGQRDFSDVLKLLEKAEHFKKWLKEKNHDKQLLLEYFKSVTADCWVDKLPYKISRWSLFTGLGLLSDFMGACGVGTVAGVAISALDQFYLDRLVNGWKPNQFVNGPLQHFVRQKGSKMGAGIIN